MRNKTEKTLHERLSDLGDRIKSGDEFLTSEAHALDSEISQITPAYTNQPFSSSVVSLAFQPLTTRIPATKQDVDDIIEQLNVHLLKSANDIDALNEQEAQTFVTEVRDYFLGTHEFQLTYSEIYKNKSTKAIERLTNAVATELYHFVPKTISTEFMSGTFSYMRNIKSEEHPLLLEQLKPQRLAIKTIVDKRNVQPYEAKPFTSSVLPIYFDAEIQRPTSEEQVQLIYKKFESSFLSVKNEYNDLSDEDKQTFIKETHKYFKGANGVLGDYNPKNDETSSVLVKSILNAVYLDGGHSERDTNERKLAADAWYRASIEKLQPFRPTNRLD